jgi:hypothetical protein
VWFSYAILTKRRNSFEETALAPLRGGSAAGYNSAR